MILAALFVFGCSQSNKITDSWVNPDATKESIKFNKVAVFGLVMKTANRKISRRGTCKTTCKYNRCTFL